MQISDTYKEQVIKAFGKTKAQHYSYFVKIKDIDRSLQTRIAKLATETGYYVKVISKRSPIISNFKLYVGFKSKKEMDTFLSQIRP